MSGITRPRNLLAGLALGLLTLLVLFTSHDRYRQKSFTELRIAVVEHTPYHDEVIGGVLAALYEAEADYDLYRDRLHRGFDEILSDVYPDSPIRLDELVPALDEGKYDVLVIVTGDEKFWGGRDDLLDAMRRSTSTHIICLVHEIEIYGNQKDLAMIAPFAEQERLTLLTLGQHSARTLKTKLSRWAWERGEPMWENVDVVHFAPVFKIPASAKLETPVIECSNTPEDGPPSRVAILGRIHQSNRDYEGIFRDLVIALTADPKPWGYDSVPYTAEQLASLPELALETSAPTHRFVPLEHADPPAFTLHLIGEDLGLVAIPFELTDAEHPIVRIHSNIEYREFYDILGAMDLILPAFSTFTYLDARSSASIPAAVIARTKVLASPALLNSYTYLSPPAYVLAPLSVSEISSIALLRQGRDPWLGTFPQALEKEIDVMSAGWVGVSASSSASWFGNRARASASNWENYERRLAKKNREVWRDMLSRTRGNNGLDSKIEQAIEVMKVDE
ncbi:hypothetical protein BCR39DRAFT_513001 [Naematelia encephala]|uniref:Uncharacterized protein n=1 Tax=Naematelia encephala TaxID=71784 RepID=A0A1Y2BMC2_9TREE|nr:hypothetical protein BCR39DRAFT_513001 [Naematelia encephala]